MDSALVERFRREFPVAGRHVYLDHAGIAPLSRPVVAAMTKHLAEAAEGGAFHYQAWAQQVLSVRSSAAKLLNCSVDEIAFVRSTSHGLSLVAEGLDLARGDNVIIFEKDFPSNLFPWLHLERKGVEVRMVLLRNGRVELADVAGRMDQRTRVLSVSSVQFTNGFRADLKALGALCRTSGALFCVDGIQSLGVLPMDVQEYGIDFLSADGHKWLCGPEGIGLFFCRKGRAELLEPALVGWKSVQDPFAFERPQFRLRTDALRFEEGSLNLVGIIGLGASLDLLLEAGIPAISERVLDLGELIIKEADRRGFTVLTPRNKQERGGNVTISGPFDPAAAREYLLKAGVMVNVRGNGLRVSPHFYNNEEDIRTFFSRLDEFRS